MLHNRMCAGSYNRLAYAARSVGFTGLLLTMPLPLAWIAWQSLQILGYSGQADFASIRSFFHVLLWGPLWETMLLLVAAKIVSQTAITSAIPSYKVAICGCIVGLGFFLSHLLLRGKGGIVSLPMSFLLSFGAAAAIQQSRRYMLYAKKGFVLFISHAMYNAALMAFAELLPLSI